jgi:hypothetical protein
MPPGSPQQASNLDLINVLTSIANAIAGRSAGNLYRLGRDTKTSSSTLLTTSYVAMCTVTASSSGGEVELDFSALIRNAGSGAGNNADIKIQCDGADLSPAMNVLSADLGTPNEGNTNGLSISHTPAAGSHTWTLMIKANAGSSVYCDQAYLRATEVK